MGYETLELDIPGGDGEKTLAEAIMVISCGRSATSSSSLPIRHQGQHLRNLLQGHTARVHCLRRLHHNILLHHHLLGSRRLLLHLLLGRRLLLHHLLRRGQQRSKRSKLRRLLSYRGTKLMRNAVRMLRKWLMTTSNRRSQRRRYP
jgi:hypothetical protein